MTALERYERLEAVGLWRETPEASVREVVVSFGNATLVLTDIDERPLGHWALAGVAAIGHAGDGTVYSMTADGGETLTIRDPEMVSAIAAVTRAPARRATAPRRWRRLPLVPVVLLAAVVALGVAAPRLIRDAATGLVPPEKAAELGDRMLIALIEVHGPPCSTPDGERALGQLAMRLDPDDPPRLRVIGLAGAPVAALPGRTVLLDRAMLSAAADPAELARLAAAALDGDPVAALMRESGPVADLRYLFTGDPGEAALARAAAAAARGPGSAVPAPAAVAPAPAGQALEADNWAALREICRQSAG